MTYFVGENAAKRYDEHRPKVHDVVLSWLRKSCADVRYKHAIDIACGTGDSTIPLTKIADQVTAIDNSECMVAIARSKGLRAFHVALSDLDTHRKFDLISVCMAYHWLDPIDALRVFKQISTNNSTWIIYNFSFAGHSSSQEFNSWFQSTFLTDFPSPPRKSTTSSIVLDKEISLIKDERGELPIQLNRQQLINYLMTMSNVEAAVSETTSYGEIEQEILRGLGHFTFDENFHYRYSYEMYRYDREIF